MRPPRYPLFLFEQTSTRKRLLIGPALVWLFVLGLLAALTAKGVDLTALLSVVRHIPW